MNSSTYYPSLSTIIYSIKAPKDKPYGEFKA